MQYKTTKLVVYWDYISKCTKNATTSMQLVNYQYTYKFTFRIVAVQAENFNVKLCAQSLLLLYLNIYILESGPI